ncbi:hypothetical protein HY249_00915 [Candidatus Azambacteria bacterium]|nr:hypothetical protein [Candidatus Azambacteria bacterium]
MMKNLIILPMLFAVFFGFLSSASAAVCNLALPNNPDPACSLGYECVPNPATPGNTTIGICSPLPATTPITFTAPTTTATFSDLVCNITNFISQSIIPPVAVLMTLVIGFMFLTSQGNPAQVKRAGNILLFTIIGVTVGTLAPGIIALVSDIFSAPGSTVSASICAGSGGTDVITNALLNLINWLAWLVATVAVVAGLYSGFLFITAGDDAAQLSKATKTFVFAIIGVAVSIAAFSIISITETFLK